MCGSQDHAADRQLTLKVVDPKQVVHVEVQGSKSMNPLCNCGGLALGMEVAGRD